MMMGIPVMMMEILAMMMGILIMRMEIPAIHDSKFVDKRKRTLQDAP